MDTMDSEDPMETYVERRDGGYYIAGTRISLDSIIHPFKNGASPEGILRSFPLIGSLEKVYGAITFYLANTEAVEAFLSEQERLSRALEAKQTPLPESLSNKLNRAREEAPR
jgi:uncharacterized protein (DUF433 family)